MGRRAKGTVDLLPGEDGKLTWKAKWTRADGGRTPWTPIPGIPAVEEQRPAAEAYAARLAPKVRAASQNDGAGERCDQWFERFYAWKKSRAVSTSVEMHNRYKRYVSPEIGRLTPGAVKPEHLERIVSGLDQAIQQWIKAGGKRGQGISSSTAANVWGDVVHAFDEMVRCKEPSLRVLDRNPCERVRGPEAGDDRQGQILYSDELLALLRGTPADPEGKPVPLYRRQAYAMSVYTKARASELEGLTGPDVDLAHAAIEIAKQADRKSKGRKATKRTKTRKKRTIDIEPNLRPLLEWLLANPQGKAGRLVHMPPPEDRAELLRKDLWTVGVRRRALHESDELERAIVLHDLRDTGLVHMAVRGDHPMLIQWTAGHTDQKTTDGYLERARVERQRIGEPLPRLPDGLVPPPAKAASGKRTDSVWTIQKAEKTNAIKVLRATPTGIEGNEAEVHETPSGVADRGPSPSAESFGDEASRDQSGHVATTPETEATDPLDVLRMTLPDPAIVIDLDAERARRKAAR